MTRGSSSSSQVGLFSTQISEQIVRLRALTKHQDGPSEAHQVDLRRAVMATRLLAGSARILRLDPLQRFLDELLQWLQTVERNGRALNTTQALILDSVVEMEEALMLHLDEVDEHGGADLSAFESQIEDLLTLVRHNLSRSVKAGTSAPEADEGIDLRAAIEGGPEELNGPQALDRAVTWFTEAFAAASDDEERASLLTVLEGPLEHLIALRAESLQRSTDERVPEPGPLAEGLDPLDRPLDDPVIGPAAQHLQDRGRELGVAVHVHAFGGGDLLAPSQHASVADILRHLADDVMTSVRAGRAEDDRSPVRVTFAISVDEGRARIAISDDAPRVAGSPLLGDSDRLALSTGLRRARARLEQSQGLIRVEPRHAAEIRFELSVPLDREIPCYALLDLEQARVAVPAALVEDVIDASGLLYDTDESGESVEHDGRSVPIADLGQFVPIVVPAAQTSPYIAVLGSVEKRLGLGCTGERTVVEADELHDAPEGWESIAYAALEVDGEEIPVLDVRRMLVLRFRSAEEQMTGALVDPLMEAWTPTAETQESAEEATPAPKTRSYGRGARPAATKAERAPAETAPAPSRRALTRVLLVNQSEFRRRDLSRTLEQLGYEVVVSDDLPSAARQLDDDEIGLLVTDLRLGQEGGESFHSLRDRHPDLRIVLTSSVAQQYARELAEKTGAHRCWLDPYRPSDLRDLLARLQSA